VLLTDVLSGDTTRRHVERPARERYLTVTMSLPKAPRIHPMSDADYSSRHHVHPTSHADYSSHRHIHPITPSHPVMLMMIPLKHGPWS
jgi:hypothetical protein